MAIPGYRLAARLVNRLPLGHGKLAQGIAGRRQSEQRWVDWASRERTDTPLVWVHGASVGECLAADSIIARLRRAIPRIQIARSFSSPSAATWAGPFAGDVCDFVPPDEPRSIRRVLDALRPSLLLFSRGDLWPELVTQSASHGIPVAVAGAAVRPSSWRLHPAIRTVFRQLYDTIAWVGAVSEADATRWTQLGVPPNRVSVTGDPRHDQVLERIPRLQDVKSVMDWCSGGLVIVAGSTHPRDERVVLGAFAAVGEASAGVRLIVVPHDPGPQRIARVMHVAAHYGMAPALWTGAASVIEDSGCVVVSALGALADLYALAHVAYVGGGLERGKLHATAEAAAYGIPVVVGPHYSNAADAVALVERGGATVLPRKSAAEHLCQTWLEWIRQPDRRIAAGLIARRTLQQGAAASTSRALVPLIRPSARCPADPACLAPPPKPTLRAAGESPRRR
ncbi:MAG: hypothetical protein JSW71_13505 [Gemmatimonadota bacterium]|nr:MAG: hypothetical protein JSW71_13505 [Gemmatimonadota bacterium]